MIEKIVSGGQTGADRAALDVAIRHGFAHGGWCPKGRIALDGILGGQYQLRETPSADYLQRTEWNVRDTDATVVFTFAAKITGGSRKTIAFAQAHGKPSLHLPLRQVRDYEDPVLKLQRFIEQHRVRVLNVAGYPLRRLRTPRGWQAVDSPRPSLCTEGIVTAKSRK